MHRGDVDHLINEIPVYVANIAENQLYLMNYPLIPATVSLSTWNWKEVKIKPSQDKISVTMDMNTEIRYNKRRETRFEPESEGTADEDSYIPPERLRIMESRPVPLSSRLRYVVGVITNGKLVLAQLKSIVEMRDTFRHLNRVDKEVEEQDESTSDPEPTKVNMKFSQVPVHQPGPKPKYARSYSFHRRHSNEDHWVDLEHSQDVEGARLENFFGYTSRDSLFYFLSSKDYLDLMFPKVAEINPCVTKHSAIQNRVSMSALKNMSLQDQLRQIMISAKLLQYSELVELLSTRLSVDVEHVTLLRALQSVAVLVQGCWAVKSDVIYPPIFVSNENGISGTEMHRGRDMILSQFRENRVVERHSLCTLTRLPLAEVTSILSHLGVVFPKCGWEFKYKFDSEFCSAYPDVVQRQKLMWEMKTSSKLGLDSKTPSSSMTTVSIMSPKKGGQAKAVTFSMDIPSSSSTSNPVDNRPRVSKRSHKKK